MGLDAIVFPGTKKHIQIHEIYIKVRYMKIIAQKIGGGNWEYTLVRLGSYTKYEVVLFGVIHYKPQGNH